jgi:excisionase family DNA binding protein
VSELIDKLIPIADAAEALGTSVSTLRWWVQIGKIGSNKPGRQRLIPVSEINRIIRESRTPARIQTESLATQV